MKSLRESLIFELNSSTYQSAHDKEVARNGGNETDRSQKFAVAAGKALKTELAKTGLVDKKTGKVKKNKTISVLPVLDKVAKTNAAIKADVNNNPKSVKNIIKKAVKTVNVKIPPFIILSDSNYAIDGQVYFKGVNVTFPKATYVIYIDKYRNAPHISTIGGMTENMCCNAWDYEGFNPKDILYTSNDPIETIKYAVDKYGEWGDDGEIDNLDDTCDDTDWAQSVLDGDDVIDSGSECSVETIMEEFVDAFVDENGKVYNVKTDDGGYAPHTENYKHYIKRTSDLDVKHPKKNSQLKEIVLARVEKEGNECDLNDIDVSKVTDMAGIFRYSKFNGDISKWDVSNVTRMADLFYDSPFNGDISKWDVSNVTNMSNMFGSTPFNQDISGWDVSNVTNMWNMFASSKFNQDINKWNVDKVTDIDNIFYECPIENKPNMQPKFKK